MSLFLVITANSSLLTAGAARPHPSYLYTLNYKLFFVTLQHDHDPNAEMLD